MTLRVSSGVSEDELGGRVEGSLCDLADGSATFTVTTGVGEAKGFERSSRATLK